MRNVHDETLDELREVAEKGTNHLKKTSRSLLQVTPIKDYSNTEIKGIREKNGFTQAYLGELLGVSIKTIQAWETGTNKPNGTALRMFQILEQDPHAFDNYILIKA